MRFLKAVLPTLAAMLVAGGVSYASLYKWSQTANSNATADSTINWAEGMAPSAVNDSARAMMAATAKFRDDTSGKLVTTGTSTAYVIASNQVFSTLAAMDGAELAFRVSATSGATPTLNVDGLGGKALNQATGVAVATGALISGAVYRATYVNASNEWIVQGIAGQVPSGTTMLSMTACPTGWTISTAANDRTLVISSTTPATAAGTTAFSTYFNGSSVSGSHVLTAAEIPLHTHGFSATTAGANSSLDHTHNFAMAAAASGGLTGLAANATSANGSGVTAGANSSLDHTHGLSGTTDTGNGVSGGSHTHTIPSLQSVTAIACTKN